MKTALSREKIRQVAGEACFTRGQALAEHAVLRDFDMTEGRAQATLSFDDESDTSFAIALSFTEHQLEGACNCPESEGFEFCEHCVVVALHAERQLRKVQVLKKGTDQEKVLAYLLNLDKSQLAALTLNFIKQDPLLISQYLLRANMTGTAVDYSAVKKQITDLTRLPEKLFTQKQILAFFQQIEAFVSALMPLEAAAEPNKLLKLVDYLFERLNMALTKMEDSQKHHQTVTNALAPFAIRLQARVTTQTTTLAEHCFNLWLKDPKELRQLSPEQVAAHLPDEAQAAYKHHFETLCSTHWSTLPTVMPADLDALTDEERSHTLITYSKLRSVLLATDASTRSAETRLSIRAKCIDRPTEFLPLARAARELGKTKEATDWFEKYLACFDPATVQSTGSNAFDLELPPKNQPLEALQELCSLLKEAHASAAALPYLWRSYAFQPNLADLEEILRIEVQEEHQAAQDIREKALRLLKRWLASQKEVIALPGWQVLVFLAPDTALELTQTLCGGPQLDSRALGYLADHIKDPPTAISLYQTAIAQAINKGNAAGYKEVEHYLSALRNGMPESTFGPYLQSLQHEHRHKRSLKERLRPFLTALFQE